jgi:tetratricopeptide (TPR) repeat protein
MFRLVALFGRKKELQTLDEAWHSYDTGAVIFEGEGGIGKSTLVEAWLQRMGESSFEGARRVYGWSFYSQGTGLRSTSADLFLSACLEWLGEKPTDLRSSWEKGNQLLGRLRKETTLLILDGLEPLQSTLSYERGQITDPGLARLVSELARDNPGLLVITTRERIHGLERFAGVHHERLERMSLVDGASYLAERGISAADADLRQVSMEFGNHALALRLLAGFLNDAYGGSVAGARTIAKPPSPEEQPAQRVMAAFAETFGAGAELSLLGILGLFERPCEEAAVRTLCEGPVISGLTDRLPPLHGAGWTSLLQRLRAAGLVAPQSRQSPGFLDAHPLVREYFGQHLLKVSPDAWRQANHRLFQYYSLATPRPAERVGDLAPLYDSMAFGILAGQPQAALDDVYWERLLRRNDQFSWSRLGAAGLDLAALANLFDRQWSQLIDGIVERDAGFVLGQAGLYLGLLGRLREALEPLQLGLARDIAQGNLANASVTAGNIAATLLIRGDLRDSLSSALQCVQLADAARDLNEQIISRTHAGHAHHYLGQLSDAYRLFEEAEDLHRQTGSAIPFLSAGQGREYAELLLDAGQGSEVKMRAKLALDRTAPKEPSDLLAYGAAIFHQVRAEGDGDLDQALGFLDRAVDLLRESGQLDQLSIGLLTRAEVRRYRGDQEGASEDLEESLQIAELSGMRLFEAEGLLCSTRLHLDRGERDRAGTCLSKASVLIEEMGYHRRQQEVARLRSRLGHGGTA